MGLSLAGTIFNFASAQTPKDGPFGVVMGEAISTYNDCKPSDLPGIYECTSLPRPHPDFLAYIVKAIDGAGICSVKAATRDIISNGYGDPIRTAADDIAAQISQKYGRSEKYDFLMSQSIWKRPNDWLTGISKSERFYSYLWSKGSKARLRDDIQTISVSAKSSDSTRSGWIFVVFIFTNINKCDDILRDMKAAAF